MSLLSYTEICELIEQGVILGARYSDVNSSSLDIHLGPKVLFEGVPDNHIIPLQDRTPFTYHEHVMPDGGSILLTPSQFILAQSVEIFNLPNNISGEYKLKSSMARIGLEHLNAGWCDAGWHGSVLTLELRNMLRYHHIELHNGTAIGQIVFFKHTEVPAEKSYAVRGRYNEDTEVSAVKQKKEEEQV